MVTDAQVYNSQNNDYNNRLKKAVIFFSLVNDKVILKYLHVSLLNRYYTY